MEEVTDSSSVGCTNFHLTSMMYFNFVFLISFFLSSLSWAEPLGTVPTVDEGRPRLILDIRSDIWLRPGQDKQEPVRIFNNELRIPIFKNEKWVASFYGQFETLSFGRTDLRIGPQQVTVGSSLRNENVGLGLRHHFSTHSSLSTFVSVRSASDEPFKNARDRWTEVSFLYFSEYNDKGYRLIALSNQSQNRGFYNGQWFPFVGVNVLVSPEFNYSLGLPFVRLNWTKASGLNTTLLITPTGINGVASHQINEKFLALSHFGIAVYSFLYTNRVYAAERAFYEEKFADIGFKYILSPNTTIGLTAGGSIDRYVYSGETAFQSNSPQNRLTNDFYSRLILEFSL